MLIFGLVIMMMSWAYECVDDACCCECFNVSSATDVVRHVRQLPASGWPQSVVIDSVQWVSVIGHILSVSPYVAVYAVFSTFYNAYTVVCTCPTVVSCSPKSQHVGTYGLLHVISWPFRHIISTLTVVRHSLSLVRWRSTLCQMICETPLLAQQLSDSCWKHTFSLPIGTFSALGVSHVMRYINLHYLLTYLLLECPVLEDSWHSLLDVSSLFQSIDSRNVTDFINEIIF